ncbi:hypothetical protein K458DRAFT_461991 [Lentithecium fluviatile CBS 122367]|uniref:Uncharacterized protein n=1 Tax=Lentithecium fluviatile CBS 122367 TaxID=1168545 RepID=A0A6G1JFX8_9PLEO|nr:hypothetical protein K458DRAFT_461991 [Lentithecium fluviatile CBS 122367]
MSAEQCVFRPKQYPWWWGMYRAKEEVVSALLVAAMERPLVGDVVKQDKVVSDMGHLANVPAHRADMQTVALVDDLFAPDTATKPIVRMSASSVDQTMPPLPKSHAPFSSPFSRRHNPARHRRLKEECARVKSCGSGYYLFHQTKSGGMKVKLPPKAAVQTPVCEAEVEQLPMVKEWRKAEWMARIAVPRCFAKKVEIRRRFFYDCSIGSSVLREELVSSVRRSTV